MYKYKYKIKTLTESESFEVNVNACNLSDAKNFIDARYPRNEYESELIKYETNNK